MDRSCIQYWTVVGERSSWHVQGFDPDTGDGMFLDGTYRHWVARLIAFWLEVRGVRPQDYAPFWSHARVSHLKSAFRIGTSVGAVIGVFTASPAAVVAGLAVGYGLAEVLGVWEEMGSRGA